MNCREQKKVRVAAIEALRDVVLKVLDVAAASPYPWGFLTCAVVAWIFRVDPKHLSPDSVATVLGSLKGFVDSSLWGILGWFLAVVTMLVATVIIAVQHQRIRSQGRDNFGNSDPERLSASDQVGLDTYSAKAKSKFKVPGEGK